MMRPRGSRTAAAVLLVAFLSMWRTDASRDVTLIAGLHGGAGSFNTSAATRSLLSLDPATGVCDVNSDCLTGSNCKDTAGGKFCTCKVHSSCAAGFWCFNPNPTAANCNPGGASDFCGLCRPTRLVGEACVESKQCKSNICSQGKCRCSRDTHCPLNALGKQDNWCDYGATVGSCTVGGATSCLCQPRLVLNSACIRSNQCKTAFKCGNAPSASGVCVVCRGDDNCGATQWCSTADPTGNEAVGCTPNLPATTTCTCENKLAAGNTCTRDRQCSSGKCHAGKCACKDDAACAADDKWCDYEGLGPLTCGVNNDCQCKPRSNPGEQCLRNAQCMTGFCKNGRCRCTANSQCTGTDVYCDFGGTSAAPLCNVADPASPLSCTCKPKQPVGETCYRNDACTDNMCSQNNGVTAGKCVSCKTDLQCSAIDAAHLCFSSSSTACNPSDDNPSDEVCVCTPKVAYGQRCLRHKLCTTAKCRLDDKCGCTSDTHCNKLNSGAYVSTGTDVSEYCEIPANTCMGRQPLGASCTRSRQCQGNKCNAVGGSAGICICSADSHCAATNQWCSNKLGTGLTSCTVGEQIPFMVDPTTCVCQNKLPYDAKCARNAVCQSGHCIPSAISERRCGCKVDGDCNDNGLWCTTAGKCAAKFATGAACLLDSQCASGTCDISGCT